VVRVTSKEAPLLRGRSVCLSIYLSIYLFILSLFLCFFIAEGIALRGTTISRLLALGDDMTDSEQAKSMCSHLSSQHLTSLFCRSALVLASAYAWEETNGRQHKLGQMRDTKQAERIR
jgi:hypothetical protein